MTHVAYVQPIYDEQSQVADWERYDSPAYLRHPRCIPLLTGTEDEASSAVLEVRYRPRSLVWTRTPPSSTGWWWCRPAGDREGAPVAVRIEGSLVQWRLGAVGPWATVIPELFEWSDQSISEPVERSV